MIIANNLEEETCDKKQCAYYNSIDELPESQRGLTAIISQMECACVHMENYPLTRPYLSGPALILNLNTLSETMALASLKNLLKSIRSALSSKDNQRFTFMIADQEGVDAGGVTRMVLYKISQYLQEVLYVDVHGLYHLCYKDRKPIEPEFLSDIAFYLCLVMQTRTNIDLPLGYGIRYVIAYGYKEEPSLSLLMALYWRENPKELKALLSMIGMSDSDIKDILPDYPQSSQVPQGAEIDGKHKYAWLYTVLYKKLFHPYNDDRRAIYHFSKYVRGWGDINEVHKYIVVPLTKANMESISISTDHVIDEYEQDDKLVEIMWNNFSTAEENIAHLKMFISRNPDYWKRLLVFIHGSPAIKKRIIVRTMNRGLPVAHTCFGAIEMRKYSSYDEFQRELKIALDNTAGLYIV